jgi:hypothetical protein
MVSKTGTRRMRTILAALITAMMLSVALPAAAQADESAPMQDGCTYQANTPFIERDQFGVYVVGTTTWTCLNGPGIWNHIDVELIRDGSRIKHAEYGRYGSFTVTFNATIQCTGPVTVYSFHTRTYGWDGLPTAYQPKNSPSAWLWCP